jgi:pimeloyl-ACP methyl ester carboxylesterase
MRKALGGYVAGAVTMIALASVVGAVITIALACVAPAAHAQSDSTPPPYPAPGRLVDVGGWRLHLNCTGDARSSQPTVILEAGLGDFSVEWSLVQPGVARFARVCSYDRAGDGWSDIGPNPRTFRQIVYELHTLLERAGERPPFVLVGHSYGGWLVRQYQSTFPSDVAGMVLVEPGAADPWRMTGDGKLHRSSELATGAPIPPVKTSDPLRVSDIPPRIMEQIRAGVAQVSRDPNGGVRSRLPADAQRMRAWALAHVGHILAGVNPVEHEELAALRAERAKSEQPLGDLPLVVITRGVPDESGPNAAAMEAEHRQDHTKAAAMSRRGKLVIATRSGHHVQLEEPELVVSAIRDVVAAAGRR